MKIEGRRRSSNFEDRGRGGGGGVSANVLVSLVRLLGVKGTLVVAVLMGLAYLFLPAGVKQQIMALFGGGEDSGQAGSGHPPCDRSLNRRVRPQSRSVGPVQPSQKCSRSVGAIADSGQAWSSGALCCLLPCARQMPGGP